MMFYMCVHHTRNDVSVKRIRNAAWHISLVQKNLWRSQRCADLKHSMRVQTFGRQARACPAMYNGSENV